MTIKICPLLLSAIPPGKHHLTQQNVETKTTPAHFPPSRKLQHPIGLPSDVGLATPHRLRLVRGL